ncbi:hypothetical protein D3C81_1944540 [compost metagenome]
MPAMTTMPKLNIRLWLIPARIDGTANGTRIFNTWLEVGIPTAAPSSQNCTGVVKTPWAVRRNAGGIATRQVAQIAVAGP